MRNLLRPALAAWMGLLSLAAAPPPADTAPTSDDTEVGADSRTAAAFAHWVVDTGDNHGMTFLVVDKIAAEVFVYRADGEPWAAAPALLGRALGDDSVPGVGDRKISDIRPEERTTPAGRFVAGFGPDPEGPPVLWVDYADAVSMHPVIAGEPGERRFERLKTPTPFDNRVTYGCINVPADFYEEVVRPAFTGAEGVVYILPEMTPVEDLFPGFQPEETPEPAPEPEATPTN